MIKKSCDIICIKNFQEDEYIFKKGKKYKAIYDKTLSQNDMYNIRLYQNENDYISFDKTSYFNIEEISKYFITIQQYRKLKLDKINNQTR